jgi:hypothetical protein
MCALPLNGHGRIPHCSERCLWWDTFGVPALRRRELRRAIVLNSMTTTVSDTWTAPKAMAKVRKHSNLAEALAGEITAAAALTYTIQENL